MTTNKLAMPKGPIHFFVDRFDTKIPDPTISDEGNPDDTNPDDANQKYITRLDLFIKKPRTPDALRTGKRFAIAIVFGFTALSGFVAFEAIAGHHVYTGIDTSETQRRGVDVEGVGEVLIGAGLLWGAAEVISIYRQARDAQEVHQEVQLPVGALVTQTL